MPRKLHFEPNTIPPNHQLHGSNSSVEDVPNQAKAPKANSLIDG